MASATIDSSLIEASAAPVAVEARGKRPVWNVPSNDTMEVGPVMGAVSWPALSESIKTSPKSSSSDSLNSLSDGLASPPSGPFVPSLSPKLTTPNPNQIQNPMLPADQKSMRHGGGSSTSIPPNGGVRTTSQRSDSSGTAQTAPDKRMGHEPSPRVSGTGGLAPQPHGGCEQHRGYIGNRRGNNSGGSHQNQWNRRDQGWNHYRNARMQRPQQHAGGLGGIWSYPQPPPPVSAPFIIPPLAVRPFVENTMGFPDVPPPLYFFMPQPAPEPLRGMPFVSHPVPHAMYFPAMDLQRALLLKQIDYYFSSENLCKDTYLKQNMDDQGWVPISLIAGFNKVKQLTNNIQYILDTLRLSTVVEVQGEKIRRRNDWMNWLLHPSHFGSTSLTGTQSLASDDDVATRLQNVNLEGGTTNHKGRNSCRVTSC